MAGINEFKDNATQHIIAFDFDGTITDSNIFPAIGKPRKYVKEIMNLLYDIGAIVIVWTCRDIDPPHDDIAPVVNWMQEHGIKFHTINSCIRHAPFHYEARKIYAHMYVDDRAYGWYENEEVLLDVLSAFMFKVMKIPAHIVIDVVNIIRNGGEVDVQSIRAFIPE